MDHKKALFHFLDSQRAMAIASQNERDLWISNVFYGIDEDFKIYFVSSEKTKHSTQIRENGNVAFSVIWFNKTNHKDRKGVQGKGKCRIANNDEEIKRGVMLHNKHFPEFSSRITVDWIKNNRNKSHLWIIEPAYIKYWDDELFREEEWQEFQFELSTT